MRSRVQRMFWPSLGILVLTAIAIGLVSVRSKTLASLWPAKPESESPTPNTAPEFKQHLRVWIHGDDLRPRIIHAWPGKALIEIANEDRADLSLQLKRITPPGLQLASSISVAIQSRRSQQELSLGVGEYVLYDEAHPNSRVKLLIEPRLK
jgi:hypothetical protein